MMHLHDSLDDRQAGPGALVGSHVLAAEAFEKLEDLLVILRSDAGPVVLHKEPHLVVH